MAPPEHPLGDRAALVTGGTGGIGTAICRALARRGANVAVAYGSNAEAASRLVSELAADGASALAFGADLEDRRAPRQLVGEVQDAFGALDLLVVNHGLARRAAYEELDAESFDRTLAVNLRAPFLLAQAAIPAMRERRFGRILFISSVAAFRGGVIGPDYAASKAGLHGLTFFLASRTASEGITVNAIAPGFIETEMLPGSPEELAGSVPVGRVGQPEEVAQLAVAVIENAYLTNHVLSLDGGMHPR